MLRLKNGAGGTLAIALFALAMTAPGCGKPLDAESGGDEKRATAKTLSLGRPSVDRVSHRDRDNTDWKRVEYLPIRGRVRVDLFWDDPSVDVTVYLRDQFGVELYAWRHPPGQVVESYRNIRVHEGDYYLEIKCSGGESVYTVEVGDEEGSGPGSGWGGDDVPPPE